jgi:anaerobic ribonucleoside-triphosphate reductase activating protein
MNLRFIYPFEVSWQDYPSREDSAIVVYLPGCNHGCKGCHNPELQDYNQGIDEDINIFYAVLERESKRNRTLKIVFEGGDPLFSKNIEGIKEFLKINAEKNKFEICIYTGYSIEFVMEQKVTGFTYIKCGKFEQSLFCQPGKTEEKMVFASSNQKLYNAKYKVVSKNNEFFF